MNAGLQAARSALSGTSAWLVGGAVRDRLLGRDSADLDVVVQGDTREAARAVARAAGGAACFALSEDFGAWRVVARDRSWQVDVEPLRGASLEEDLALRDFTVNAIAEPLAGGAAVDPLGGEGDLRARLLRMAGPGAFEEDPLRVLRLVRVAVELELEPEAQTLRAASVAAQGLARVSGERVFMELRRIVASERARAGLELVSRLGAGAVVLGEIEALAGVEQSRFHHADVLGHTLEVLDQTIALQRTASALAGTASTSQGTVSALAGTASAPGTASARPGTANPLQETASASPGTASTAGAGQAALALAPHAAELSTLLAEPLTDEMTRGEGLRWGALLHDAAKPLTREVRPADGRVTFIGHDRVGAELARDVLARLRASERLRAHVAGLVRNHLRLGFLIHKPQPLHRRTVYAYLHACTPVEVDVTLLSIADRLATRGDRSAQAIEEHLALARTMLGDALSWRASWPPAPLVRGDELAGAVGIDPGPRLGRLIEALAAARYAGEISSREQAIAKARQLARTI